MIEENKEALKRLKVQRQQEYREGIPIKGKLGEGKNDYRLNHIRAKFSESKVI